MKMEAVAFCETMTPTYQIYSAAWQWIGFLLNFGTYLPKYQKYTKKVIFTIIAVVTSKFKK
jgi:hypothetical protein